MNVHTDCVEHRDHTESPLRHGHYETRILKQKALAGSEKGKKKASKITELQKREPGPLMFLLLKILLVRHAMCYWMGSSVTGHGQEETNK